MLEVFYSIRLKPYLLSLLLSRKQTQIQSWKVLIVFEEPGGRYSIIRSEVLLQLMILFKRYPQTRMRGALSWKIVAALTVGWGGGASNRPSLRQTATTYCAADATVYT